MCCLIRQITPLIINLLVFSMRVVIVEHKSLTGLLRLLGEHVYVGGFFNRSMHKFYNKRIIVIFPKEKRKISGETIMVCKAKSRLKLGR